jgi:hypothetical protein
VDRSTLRWLRAEQDRHEFQLAAEDDVVATLRWKSTVGSLAVAESAQGRWTLKRTGFLNPAIGLREADTGKDLGRLLAHGSHGSWIPAEGERLDWRRTSLLIPGWRFQDAKGNVVLEFEPVREKLRLVGALLTIAPKSESRPDLLQLLVVGLYFIALAWLEDQAAATSEGVLSATVGP